MSVCMIGVGLSTRRISVVSSGASALVMFADVLAVVGLLELPLMMRLKVYAASLAVRGTPSVHFRPARIL